MTHPHQPFQPRQIVCQPGQPSLRRARNPPTAPPTPARCDGPAALGLANCAAKSASNSGQRLWRPPVHQDVSSQPLVLSSTVPPRFQHGHQRFDPIGPPFHLAILRPVPLLERFVIFLHTPAHGVEPHHAPHLRPSTARQRGQQQPVQRLDPGGAATSRTSTTFTGKSGCLPLSRRAHSSRGNKSELLLGLPRRSPGTGAQFYGPIGRTAALSHRGFEMALAATGAPGRERRE